MSDASKSCTYNGASYKSGKIICQENDNGEGVCMECQDGTWVPIDKTCEPAHDPGTACS
ncbi:MAG: hypothetical protein AB8H80_09750 [Planctomycetota bacterium]